MDSQVQKAGRFGERWPGSRPKVTCPASRTYGLMRRIGTVPTAGLLAGCCLVLAGGPLPWPTSALSVVHPGYEYPSYLAAASLAVISVALGLLRWNERTALVATLSGIVAASLASVAWGGGRYYVFLGGVAVFASGLIGYAHDPHVRFGDISLGAPDPTVASGVAFAPFAFFAVAVAGLGLGTTAGHVELLGVLLVAAAVLAAGAVLCLYWWSETVGFSVAIPVAVLVTLAPVAILAPDVGPVVAGSLVVVLVTAWLAAGFLVRARGDVLVSASIVRGPDGPRPSAGSLARVASLPLLLTTLGLVLVASAGGFRWALDVPGATVPEFGLVRPEYYVALALAVGAVEIVVLRPTDRGGVATVVLGALALFTVAGPELLEGGRLLAAVGGALLVAGGLLASRTGEPSDRASTRRSVTDESDRRN